MKFGVVVPSCREGFYVPVPFGTPDHFVKAARLAEKLGFYSVWCNDHLNPTKEARARYNKTPNFYESLITLAFMGSATKSIKLGTSAMVLPIRDIIVLSKQVSTLDILSHGRLLLGVGVGIFKEEFATVRPLDVGKNRGAMMEEMLEAMTSLFDKEEVTFKGKYYQFQDIALSPKPVQKPFPFYISGNSSETFKRVAKWGTGWLLSGSSQASVGDRIERLKPFAEEMGRDISKIDMTTTSTLAIYSSHRKDSTDHRLNLLKTNRLVGTASEIVQKIESLAKEGITHILLQDFPVNSFDEMLEQMQMFGEDVIPLAEDL